jgi:hypothetical protein
MSPAMRHSPLSPFFRPCVVFGFVASVLRGFEGAFGLGCQTKKRWEGRGQAQYAMPPNHTPTPAPLNPLKSTHPPSRQPPPTHPRNKLHSTQTHASKHANTTPSYLDDLLDAALDVLGPRGLFHQLVQLLRQLLPCQGLGDGAHGLEPLLVGLAPVVDVGVWCCERVVSCGGAGGGAKESITR